MRKLFVLGLMLLAGVSQTLLAIPARRDIIKEIVQPDGSVLLVKTIGDERAHGYVTVDNIPVIKNEKGAYCFAMLDASGDVVASDVVARNIEQRSADDARFVTSINSKAVGKAMLTPRSPLRQASASSGIGMTSALFPHMGDVNALVILVQYSDIKFSQTDAAKYYNAFFNEEGFSEDNGTGSVRDYFRKMSDDQFRPTFDAYGPVTLSKKRAYYGENDYMGQDARVGEMIYEACKLLDSEINYADYDIDEDGYVDNIYVIYAGQGEASYGPAESIWPHQWEMKYAYSGVPTLDGVKINNYGCSHEYDYDRPAGIGTFVHEFSHVMGLADHYTTDYTEADELTPGTWDVMDYGSYNNDSRTPAGYSVFERNALGWIDLTVLDSQASIELQNIHDSNQGCIIQTGDPNEFFLFENRQQVGWDKYLPGHGMLVWHIDYDAEVWEGNVVNNDARHLYVDIEEANNNPDNTNNKNMAGYAFPGTSNATAFTDDTTPSMRTWDNKPLKTPIENIQEKDGVIYFDVLGGYVEMAAPVPVASEISSGGFKLSWPAVDGAFSYVVNVYAKDEIGKPVGVVGYVDLEVFDTMLVISRLNAELNYYATVTAKRNSILSEPSNEVMVTTGEFVFALAVPQVLPATNVTKTSFTANWQAVKGATDYLLTIGAEAKNPEITADANFGEGNKLEFPEGWSSTSSAYYGSSSTGYYGDAAPSLKLAKSGQYLQTPVYDNRIIAFEFWIRNAGGSSENSIEIQGNNGDGSWVEFFMRDNISTAKVGEYIKLSEADIPADVRQIRLVYNKLSSGNIAIDDVVLTTGGTNFMIIDGYDSRSVGSVTSHNVEFLSTDIISCVYNVKAIAADGTTSLLSDNMDVILGDNLGVADEVVDRAASLKVEGNNVEIYVTPYAEILVSDLSGRVVVSGQTDKDGCYTFVLPTGFYIIKIGSKAIKTIIR